MQPIKSVLPFCSALPIQYTLLPTNQQRQSTEGIDFIV